VKGRARSWGSFVRLTTHQVAGRLGVSVRRVRELVIRGPLEGIRRGRRILVEVDALERYRRAA